MQILVIDPVSSGPELVSHLERRGHQVTCYYQKAPAVAQTDASKITVDAELIDLVRTHTFNQIIAGSDYGVVAAEFLASKNDCDSNAFDLIWARRDKQAMIDACAEQGLRVPRSWRISSLEDLHALETEFRELPQGAVIKPASSAGSDSCSIAHTVQEILDSASSLLGKVNLLGTTNTSCIVQERVVGDQYFVNTVSSNGQHLVTEFFVYGIDESNGVPHIYSALTLSESGSLFESARDYAFAVNDALGVRFSASHTEMRLTPEGWVLIEYNGRSMGPTVPDDVYLPSRGFSQISLWAECVSNGLGSASTAKLAGNSSHHVAWHMPQPTASGVLVSTNWSDLEQLATFNYVAGEPQSGTEIDLENRVTTASHGLVFFSSTVLKEIARDLEEARIIELSGSLFNIQSNLQPAF